MFTLEQEQEPCAGIMESPLRGIGHPRTLLPPTLALDSSILSTVQEVSVKCVQERVSEGSQWERFKRCPLDFADGRIWGEEKEAAIRQPYEYIASRPGKEFRSIALDAFNAWLQVPSAAVHAIASTIRMLHTASLLIDDIQDSSSMRRGRPTAHKVYGAAQTINSANYYYFLAMRELRQLSNHAEVLDIFESEMIRLHQGQGMELYWRDNLICPSEEDYLEMISNKTGGLFRLAVRLMQSQSSSNADCVPLAQLLGLIFQIADDYKNLTDPAYNKLKGDICEDLTEGKFSFPVVHSIREDPDDGRLLAILARKTTDPELKLVAVDLIRATGSLEYTKRVVSALIWRAESVADELDAGRNRAASFKAVLRSLAVE